MLAGPQCVLRTSDACRGDRDNGDVTMCLTAERESPSEPQGDPPNFSNCPCTCPSTVTGVGSVKYVHSDQTHRIPWR
jgi:hypothetical protein